MAELDVYTPWSSIKPFVQAFPTWVEDELESERIASYALYDQMYWMLQFGENLPLAA